MKTVIITGASRGIGRATAKLFAQNGYNVVICYNQSFDDAKTLEDQISAFGVGVLAVQVNMSNTDDIKRMIESAYDRFGCVDVLVNNAGISMTSLVSDCEDAELDNIMSVNFDGVFKCCREVIPYMLKEHNGSIVNVSSVWGISGASCEVAYSSSKAAVIGLTKALSKELGPSGIRVNCVAPGVIDTDMNSCHSKEVLSELAEQTSLCRIGKPDEVAEAIYFLASDKSSFITGQILTVDGGFI